MFGIGTEELMLILVIALVVLGPERMPKLARDLGRMVGDFRRTSDELRNEFLNADKIIDIAATSASTPAIAPSGAASPFAEAASPVAGAASPVGETAPSSGAEGVAPATLVDIGVPLSAEALLQPGETPPATDPDGTTVPPAAVTAGGAAVPAAPAVPADPDETLFDREAREAHERLGDPARARQAAAEGWKTPSDEAGTTDRWG